MKKTLTFLTVLLLFSCSDSEPKEKQSTSQPTGEILPLIEAAGEGCFAVYHFGVSETETDLIINGVGNKFYAQIRSGYFGDEGKSWIHHYENLKNVRIEGNKFYSDKTNGEFVMGKNGMRNLKVYNTWSEIPEDDGSEIGQLSYSIDKYYAGNYTEASLKLLTAEELQTKTKDELKLMRNEIFARYEYLFKTGGVMDNYFKAQKWYEGHHKNVDKYLTWLEKENIALLKKVEANSPNEEVIIGIYEFPKKWIGLTENEQGDFYIQEPCLEYNKAFEISKYQNGTWFMFVVLPFDGEQFDITDIQLKGSDIHQQYYGKILLDKKDAEGGAPDTLTVFWHKNDKWLYIDNYFGKSVYFVSEENKDAYKTVKESPCDEDDHY